MRYLENVMESDEGLLGEVQELLAWWEVNKDIVVRGSVE